MSKIRLIFMIIINILILFITHQFFNIFSLIFKVIKITDTISHITAITEKLLVDTDIASKVLDLTSGSLSLSMLLITVFVLTPLLLITVLLFSVLSVKKDSCIRDKDLKFSRLIVYLSTSLSVVYSTISYTLSMLFYIVIYHIFYYLIWDKVFIKKLDKQLNA